MTTSEPNVRDEREPRIHRPAVAILAQLPLLIGLVLLWVVLWGHIDVISVTTGTVFSLAVVRVFALPPVLLSGRVHVWFGLVLLAKVLWWLVSATFQMAWLALRPQPVPQSSIIGVRLRVHSDWLLTLCAEINMLVPGSVVVEVDRSRSILYLHVLDADTDQKIATARAAAEAIEDAVVKALGNREHLALLNDDRTERGRAPLYVSKRQRAYEAERCRRREARERAWTEAL